MTTENSQTQNKYFPRGGITIERRQTKLSTLQELDKLGDTGTRTRGKYTNKAKRNSTGQQIQKQ